MSYKLFTSESVSEGHPDKLADQISDGVLDAILSEDVKSRQEDPASPSSRVACEVLVKTGLVVVAGEVKTDCYVNIEEIARGVIEKVGYTNHDYGMDNKACAVINVLGEQSPDIARGVERDKKNIGAGDQGMMFGYATDETDVFMPIAITYAHRLVRQQASLRRTKLNWLRPDAKSQITFRFDEANNPIAVDTIVLSVQHDPGREGDVEEAAREEIIKPVMGDWYRGDIKIHINPTGSFVIGGPQGDCGLTGRKIIVDTYGGAARHGGGCFSGKDPSKVDRSAAYAARYVAKNLVAAGLANKCEIQLSYAIGRAEPTSISIDTYGTGKLPDDKLAELVRQHFDLRPGGIIEMLDLERPIYAPTAAYGHFGRDEFPWEQTDRAEVLAAAAA